MNPTVRKILKFLCIACIVYGIMTLSGPLAVNILYLFLQPDMDISVSETASIGIIGGADGPTSILIAASSWVSYLPALILLLIGAVGLYCLRK